MAQTSYTQHRLHAGERALKRNKVEELSRNNKNLAIEALAGLASRENFSAVCLRRVNPAAPPSRELPPYTHPMLLRVKGRRHAEARLLQPVPVSINQGDDFVLVTPTEVYHYHGEFANVIERAKASEIAAFIVQQKDLGVTSAGPVMEVTENVKGVRRTRFWEVLGGNVDSAPCPPSSGGDDEELEASLGRSNKVYLLQGSALVPHPLAWGKPPTVDLLSSEQVLVFDFGSEVYAWSGKRADAERRRAGVALARELWDEPYDYTDCDVNPVNPIHSSACGVTPDMTGPRPAWGVCGKLTQNLETVLFKDKFLDWPDTAQQTWIKEAREEGGRRREAVCPLRACTGAELTGGGGGDAPDLELEMTHLGRGTQYYDAEERRLLMITTKEYKVWHVGETGKVLLSARGRVHFHAADTYVVRWYYGVMATGRTLTGAPSKHAVTGRERVAYFFWQGCHSSLSDKGASALMTVELDEERGPHIRVEMGAEPPAFLNLFGGAFVVHGWRRSGEGKINAGGESGEEGEMVDSKDGTLWLMFLVRGEAENEGHLIGADVNRAHLRSRGCLLLVDLYKSLIHLWHGCKALKHTRQIAITAAKHLSESAAEDVPWCSAAAPRVKEQFEGTESKEFWDGITAGEALNPQIQINSSDVRQNNINSEVRKLLTESLTPYKSQQSKKFQHLSLLNESSKTYNWTPRLWQLKARHNCFSNIEVTCPHRLQDVPNPMPFTQEDLYGASQPGLFLMDAGGEVWLWQGWWPAEDGEPTPSIKGAPNGIVTSNGGSSDGDNHNDEHTHAATTGSAALRFNFARKAALQTALNYAEHTYGKAKREPKLIVAGLEPLEFTNLFPLWKYRTDVTSTQKKEGRYTSITSYSVSIVLAGLSRSHYTLAELQAHPLPDGVDPSRLEDYLTDEDFASLVTITREQYEKLQPWKKLEYKKRANLF